MNVLKPSPIYEEQDRDGEEKWLCMEIKLCDVLAVLVIQVFTNQKKNRENKIK